MIVRPILFVAGVVAFSVLSYAQDEARRYAASDNHSGYVHWIDLYDSSNLKIDPAAENPKPYSPLHTCGRCHDFQSISHGWHFNAIDPSLDPGRRGQPWIWSDGRTGTHLPLSYRDWKGTFRPDQLGISKWQMAATFGSYLPGGGPGSLDTNQPEAVVNEFTKDRSGVTGALPVDCMICHRDSGSDYSPFIWSEQVADENFAYAPTVALGIGTVEGTMKRLKDDFDPKAEGASAKLPQVSYDLDRFRSDGKLFFDLVRKPHNDACYYCHTNVDSNAVTGERWMHDEDVHVRAGIGCADCHRNGLDHHTVRGFEGEVHPSGTSIASLSCQGCHIGAEVESSENSTIANLNNPGRLGAPTPRHAGIPPLHFDKLSCTACHSGPMPGESLPREMNSIVHRLGAHERRTGLEFPAIVGPVSFPLPGKSKDQEGGSSSKYTPQRLMWPSYWGTLKDAKVTPLHPDESYDLLRKPLKTRRDFTEELSEVKLPISKRTELLGAERARLKPEDLNPEEASKIAAAESEMRDAQIAERMGKSLEAIASKYPDSSPVYITGGTGFTLGEDGKVVEVDQASLGDAADFYSWPMAHSVRPATMSWGAKGCVECHRDQSPFFDVTVTPVGLLPNQDVTPSQAHQLQQVDRFRMGQWNQMFAGRSTFKYISFLAMGLTLLAMLAAFIGKPGWIRFQSPWSRRLFGLIYFGFFLCILVLGVTSFGSLWTTGHVLGYPLLAHLTAAGAFVFLLLIVTVAYLPTGPKETGDGGRDVSKSCCLRTCNRASLWALIIASVVTAGSMLISMLPMLDTPGLLQAALVHRYSGLVVIAMAVINVMTLRQARRGKAQGHAVFQTSELRNPLP